MAVPLFDRELSWISFNGRVLQEAADARVPLYERVKFLAIYSSNLDEFFRVRVAGLRSLMTLKKKKRKELDFDPRSLLGEMYSAVDAQQREFGRVFEELRPLLRAAGTPLLGIDDIDEEQRDALLRWFDEHARPHIDCAEIKETDCEVFFRNRVLYLVVETAERERGGKDGKRKQLFRLTIPSAECPRFVPVSAADGSAAVIFLDDVLRLALPSLFPELEVRGAWAVKLNRDADLHIEDEFSGDLVKKIREALKGRETGAPARFLYDPSIPRRVLARLRRCCGLKREDFFPGGRYHNFHDLFAFPRREGEGLSDAVQAPLPHPVLSRAASLFEAVAASDHLLHVPYQDFDPVPRFLEEAATDEAVEEIAITLYRIAGNSRIAQALEAAAQRGKRVFVFMEIKARFDEETNLRWSERLRAAGAQVAYSIPGLKVHTKLFLITRREGEAAKRYAYLGTGNFNESTAKLYTDFGMFTAAEDITSEVATVFGVLRGEADTPEFDTLLVAQYNLREDINRRIDREIEHARAGRPCGIFMKLNSLEDPKITRRLYRASQAGVPVRLIVRGICVLVPGVAGVSESIVVTSIVDRYLEHARVYMFTNGGDEDMLLASADMMRRNLNRRIEVAFPVRDEALRAVLREAMDIQLRDNVKSRVIDAKQGNAVVTADEGEAWRAQERTYRMLAERRNDEDAPIAIVK